MIDDETLIRWLEQDLPPAQADAIETRLTSDAALRDRVEDLRALLDGLDALGPEPVPAAVQEAARARMTARPARRVSSAWVAAAVATLALGIGLSRRSPPPATLILDAPTTLHGPAVLTWHAHRLTLSDDAILTLEEDDMWKTHLAAAATGAAVTLILQSGTATLVEDGDKERSLAPGTRIPVGDVPEEAAPEPPSPPTARSAAMPPPTDGPDEATRSELATLRMENALLRGQLAQFMGEPTTWPEDLPAALRPHSFEDTVLSALDEGPFVLEAVDCDEFPCVAVLSATGDGGTDWSTSTRTVLDRLEGQLPEGMELGVTAMNSVSEDPTGSHALLGLALTPDAAHDPDLAARVRYRLEGRMTEFEPAPE